MTIQTGQNSAGEATVVDIWVDPVCPFAWLTSRWLVEVAQVRPISVIVHIMSLAVLNEDKDIDSGYRQMLETAWAPVRVALAVEQQYGAEKLAQFYTAIGTRIHVQQEKDREVAITAALAELGLPAELIDAGRTDAADTALRESHHAGMDPVGDEVGTPVVRLNGKSMFGPVITRAPKGEAAGRMFDGFSLVTEFDYFYELKRSRDTPLVFD